MFRNFTQVVDYAKKLETKDLIVANPEDTNIVIAINDAFQIGRAGSFATAATTFVFMVAVYPKARESHCVA